MSKSHDGQGAALANVCGKKCDHGSECLLLKGHEPADRHETQHGCVFYDEEPAVRPHSVPGWWQVWSGGICVALLTPDDVKPIIQQKGPNE